MPRSINASKPAAPPSAPAATATSFSSTLLHPCLRVFGKCNFGTKCKFAQLPANCCLSFLKKGKCTSKNCKYPHLSSATATAVPAVVSSSKILPPSSLVSSTTTKYDVQAEENEITDLMMILSPSFEDELLIPGNFFSSSSSPSSQEQQVSTTTTVVDETVLLKNKCDSLDKEITSLKFQHSKTIENFQAQHDVRIKAEREQTARVQKELEESKQRIELQKDSFRLFREQLPELIINKFISSSSATTNKNDDDDTNNNNQVTITKLVDIIKSLHEKVEIEALSLRRMTLLSKVFDIANAKFLKEKDAQGAQGYSSLVPNECLFSDVSPVAQMFQKACPDMTLAKELFNAKTGEFNTERFEIVFHGTKSVEGALAIQCGGLDPKRRSGQAMGRGEYSATHISTALGYSCGMLLAFLVYKPDNTPSTYTEQELKQTAYYTGTKRYGPVNHFTSNGIFVIDNPTDKTSTYMLPLGCSYLFSQQQVKTANFVRKCSCTQKQAERAMEEAKRSQNGEDNNSTNNTNNNKSFNGKRFFYKEKKDTKDSNDENNNKNQYQQLNDTSSQSLLKILYKTNTNSSAPAVSTTSSTTNKKNSSGKNSSKKNNNNNNKATLHRTLHYTMMTENEPCSVDLEKFEMVNLKSGKVYTLAVW